MEPELTPAQIDSICQAAAEVRNEEPVSPLSQNWFKSVLKFSQDDIARLIQIRQRLFYEDHEKATESTILRAGLVALLTHPQMSEITKNIAEFNHTE
jgi:hypothetical protein